VVVLSQLVQRRNTLAVLRGGQVGGEKPTELDQGVQTLHERERKSEGGMRRGRSGSKGKEG